MAEYTAAEVVEILFQEPARIKPEKPANTPAPQPATGIKGALKGLFKALALTAEARQNRTLEKSEAGSLNHAAVEMRALGFDPEIVDDIINHTAVTAYQHLERATISAAFTKSRPVAVHNIMADPKYPLGIHIETDNDAETADIREHLAEILKPALVEMLKEGQEMLPRLLNTSKNRPAIILFKDEPTPDSAL